MQYTPQPLGNTEVNLRQYTPQPLSDTVFNMEEDSGMNLIAPADGATGVSKTPTLQWESFDAELIRVLVWDDDGSGGVSAGQPNNLIIDAKVSGNATQYVIPDELAGSEWHHWRTIPTKDITPVPGDVVNEITGTTITPATATVTEGQTLVLEGEVQGTGTYNQSGTWTRDGDMPFTVDGNTISLSPTTSAQSGVFRFTAENGMFTERTVTAEAASTFTPDSSLQGQLDALNSIYTTMDGANWTNNTGWGSLTTANMGDAYGVETDASGNVITVDLFENNLTGDLNEIIGNLTYIKTWSIKGNSGIYSKIPKSIEHWTSAVNLLFSAPGSHNIPDSNNHHPGKSPGWVNSKYYGTIPDVFDQMPNLKVLEIMWSEDFDFQPYPSTLYQHDNLRYLGFTGNNFTGELEDIFNLPSLEVMFIGSNNFSGNIPSSIGNSVLLEKLMLGISDIYSSVMTERFTGNIPDSFANLVNMQRFFIGNQNVGGVLPDFVINAWTGLREISIGKCNFEGELPGAFGDFDLKVFDISGNNFTGNLPVRIVSGMQRVITFDISGNNFSGDIPQGEIINGEFKGWRTKVGLRSPNLIDNNFSGPLPDMPEYVGDMTYLLLHRNDFEGGIPDSWQELFTLSEVNKNTGRTFDNCQIRGNNLQGVLPSWFTGQNMVEDHPDIRGNRWCHNDILTNFPNGSAGHHQVADGVSSDEKLKPFGFPVNETLNVGDPLTIDYSHKVHATDDVEWRKDGQPISGETTGILTRTSVQSSDAGEYELRLTNPDSGLNETVYSEIYNVTIS